MQLTWCTVAASSITLRHESRWIFYTVLRSLHTNSLILLPMQSHFPCCMFHSVQTWRTICWKWLYCFAKWSILEEVCSRRYLIERAIVLRRYLPLFNINGITRINKNSPEHACSFASALVPQSGSLSDRSDFRKNFNFNFTAGSIFLLDDTAFAGETTFLESNFPNRSWRGGIFFRAHSQSFSWYRLIRSWRNFLRF